jgi:hypothetical protein
MCDGLGTVIGIGGLGTIGTLLTGDPLTGALIGGAVYNNNKDTDFMDITEDVFDPLNLIPGGYLDEQAKRDAQKLVEEQRSQQETAFANANILGMSRNLEARKRFNASGASSSIYGGANSNSVYKSLLGI